MPAFTELGEGDQNSSCVLICRHSRAPYEDISPQESMKGMYCTKQGCNRKTASSAMMRAAKKYNTHADDVHSVAVPYTALYHTKT